MRTMQECPENGGIPNASKIASATIRTATVELTFPSTFQRIGCVNEFEGRLTSESLHTVD